MPVPPRRLAGVAPRQAPMPRSAQRAATDASRGAGGADRLRSEGPCAKVMANMTRAVVLALLLAAGVAVEYVRAEEPSTTPAVDPEAGAGDRVVGPEMDVAINYTLTVDGVVVDSTSDEGPLRYIHGHGQLFPALERQLEGLRVGDTREVTLAPADGYGEIDPSLIEEIPKVDLPSDAPPAVGMVLRGVNPDGQKFQARIVKVKPDTVMVNLNDPLAGKTLHFKVTVADIIPLQ